MTYLVAVNNSAGPRWCYVNSGPSAAITNVNGETAFDQVFGIPSQSQMTIQPTSIIRVRVAGIFSTDTLLGTGLTLNTRWGGISGTLIQSTGAFIAPISQTNMAWWIQGVILVNTIGSVAEMESQFFTSFDANATMLSRLKNGAPIPFSSIAGADLTVSANWAVASANNSIQIRAMVVEIDAQ